MGNEHPGRFLDLLASTDGPVLDNGSAGRQWPGVINLDILATCNTVDVRADALALPFPDNSFALVLSQAVLEHVTDPQAYVDEITRILRPGGLVYIEAAFMQIVHQAPHHYFNVTPFGLMHLVRHMDTVDSGVLGLLAENWDWLARDTDATHAIGAARVAYVRESLDLLDHHLTDLQHAYTAPGVHCTARKR